MCRFDKRNFFPVGGFSLFGSTGLRLLAAGLSTDSGLWQRRGEMTACVASGQPSGHSPDLSASLSHMRTLSAPWPSLWLSSQNVGFG